LDSTRTSSVTVILLFVTLALIIGTVLPWSLNSAWFRLPLRLDAVGWISLFIVGGLAVFAWQSRMHIRVDFFEPVYFITLLFLMVFFLRPIQLLLDYDARVRFVPDDPQLFQSALLLGALGFICFLGGYLGKMGILIGRKLPAFGEHWSQRRVVQVAIAYTLIGMAGYSFAVARSGGFGLFLSTLQGRRLLAAEGNWVFASALYLVHAAMLITGAYWFKTKRLGALFLICLILSAGSAVAQGGRSAVLVNMLALLVMFYYLRAFRPGRILINTLIIGMFAALGLYFVVIQKAIRTQTLGVGVPGAVIAPSKLLVGNAVASFVKEFTQFDWFVIILDIVPSLIVFQHGKTFLQFFAMFVPQTLWPAKPLPISFVTSMQLGGARSGTPFTLVGELYLNFHVPGIILGMVLFGIFVRALYAYLRKNINDPAVILLYAYSFSSLHGLFTRTFAPRAFTLVLFMIPTIFALRYISRGKTPAP
jgi:hypothetical protein